MKQEIAIQLDGVSKKFCRSLKRSMWYGALDIVRDGLCVRPNLGKLRKKEFWAVDDVSFELRRGKVLGIIGPNGAGKTTILKMLNGIILPDKGKVTVRGRVGALIAVGAGFHPQLTGRENVYINGAILGMSKREIDRKFKTIVDFSEIGEFLDTPVKHYSSGMFIRLGFSVAVHCDPDILLVDEVLAVGDWGFRNKCFRKMGDLKSNGTAMILVSHAMHNIVTFCDEVLLFRNGKPQYFPDVGEGVAEYTRLFDNKEINDIEKVCSGVEGIEFFDVEIEKDKLEPGDSFKVSLSYESSADYDDVVVDSKIYSGREADIYFQAANRVFGKRIDLHRGRGRLEVQIKDIRINNSKAKVVIQIWTKQKDELLFWWRIPIEFNGNGYCTGSNLLDMEYSTS